MLVLGACPPTRTEDECTSIEDRNKALTSIPKTRPRKVQGYGKESPMPRACRKINHARK